MASKTNSIYVYLSASDSEYRKVLDNAQKATTQFADTQTKQLGKANKQTAAGLQNVSFQVQDIAVQMGAGTSATQAFAQQLPQLLSGFGVFGAVAGTAVAILGGIASGLERAERAAETYSTDVKTLTTDIENLTKAEATYGKVLAAQDTKSLDEQLAKNNNLIKAQQNIVTILSRTNEGLDENSSAYARNQKAIDNAETEIARLNAANAKLDRDYQAVTDSVQLFDAVLSGDTDTLLQHQGALDSTIATLQEQIGSYGKSAYEIARYTILNSDASEGDKQRALALLEVKKALDDKATAEAKAAAKTAEYQRQQLSATQQAQAELQRLQIANSGSELERIKAEEQAKLDFYQERYEKGLIDEETYQQLRTQIQISYGNQYVAAAQAQEDQLTQKIIEEHNKRLALQQSYTDAVFGFAENLGSAYSSTASQLANATDEEAQAIKTSFLLEQAAAAGRATVNYFQERSAINATAAAIDAVSLGVGGKVYKAAQLPLASSNYAITLSGILATTLGGVAAFESGSDYIQGDQLAYLHNAERVVPAVTNRDLTQFLDDQKSGGNSNVTNIYQTVDMGANMVDPAVFNQALNRSANNIAAIVQKKEAQYPTRGRRNR